MMRSFATLWLAAAVYGFSIGASNSWLYAVRNLVKFPLLIVATAAVCAVSYLVAARALAVPLPFVAVQRAVLAVFRDMAVMLAGLSPAVFFLAMTSRRAGPGDLGDYPLFQGLNVAAIALCGCLAVLLQVRRLRADETSRRGAGRLMAAWMLVSLLVGGQMCWYLRPFFGILGPGEAPPWFSGDRPDFRGARSFYEAVWNLVSPPEGR